MIGFPLNFIRGIFPLNKKIVPLPRHSKGDDHGVIKFVQELTGIKKVNSDIFLTALTHSSYQSKEGNNERLEFLGDSVLCSVVGHAVYELYPEDDEGSLSQLRAYLVSRNHINIMAKKLGFAPMIRIGGGIDLEHSDIMGNALEAFVGALYLEGGYDACVNFIRKKIIVSRKSLDESYEQEEDAKTAFIILMQKHKIPFEFSYTDSHTDEEGNLTHTCDLRVGTGMQTISQGAGSSKKLAHQNAARKALQLARQNPEIIDNWR